MKYILLTLLFPLLFVGCKPNRPRDPESATLERMDRLQELDTKLAKPKPGEWLASFKEDGQSFEAYQAQAPVRPSRERRTIYLQPIGQFTPQEWQVVGFTASYVEVFFGLKTILLPILSESIIPPDARRIQEKGHEQFHTLYILDSVLVKRIPTDGIVLMAITAKDLYPGKQWNYVFGQANMKKRVGVSSLSRLYDWPLTVTNYQLFLRRIIKTATHEIGHMFTVPHCIHAPCLMNGSNSLEEADQRPTYLCSECLKKFYWNWHFDPVQRNQGLIQFFEAHHMAEELEHYQMSVSYLAE